jgi:hypothetical protein
MSRRRPGSLLAADLRTALRPGPPQTLWDDFWRRVVEPLAEAERAQAAARTEPAEPERRNEDD